MTSSCKVIKQGSLSYKHWPRVRHQWPGANLIRWYNFCQHVGRGCRGCDNTGQITSPWHPRDSISGVPHIDGSVQNCSISSTLAMEIPQPCSIESQVPYIKSFMQDCDISSAMKIQQFPIKLSILYNVYDLALDCSISHVSAMDIPQSWAKPSMQRASLWHPRNSILVA